jgi:hypothetical protein
VISSVSPRVARPSHEHEIFLSCYGTHVYSISIASDRGKKIDIEASHHTALALHLPSNHGISPLGSYVYGEEVIFNY